MDAMICCVIKMRHLFLGLGISSGDYFIHHKDKWCYITVIQIKAGLYWGGFPDIRTLKYCKTLENMVENQAAKNRHCAAICDAHAIAFGSRDLLTGMKATCSSFMELLSSIATATESRVEKDNNVVTSRGPGTAIEYAIALVEQLYDGKKATELSEELVSKQ